VEGLGKLPLMALAGVVFLAGAVVFLVGRFGGGSLPGDIIVKRPNFTFAFPLVTCLVVSVILTIVLNLIFRR
jgi:hypothetical protein